MSNLHRSLANAQLSPRVLLSVLLFKNMPLSKPSIPCVILKTYNGHHGLVLRPRRTESDQGAKSRSYDAKWRRNKITNKTAKLRSGDAKVKKTFAS